MIVGIENDFSDDEFAAIGKLVWSFTVLEHELSRAALKLHAQVALQNSTGPIDAILVRTIKGTLRGRFDSFVSALNTLSNDDETKSWIEEAKEKFADGAGWRDRVCHGNWRRFSDGRLSICFHDRDSMELERDVDYEPVSLKDLSELTDTTLSWAIEIARKAGTVPQ